METEGWRSGHRRQRDAVPGVGGGDERARRAGHRPAAGARAAVY